MADKQKILTVRKVSQQYAYASLQMHEAIARKAGFGGTDHKYLGFFLQKGSLTAGELAGLSGLTSGAVTGLIDRFEKRELVKRIADKKDRRKVVVVPDTEKITALMKPLYQTFQNESEKLLGTFSDQELEVIEHYLFIAMKLANETKLRIESQS
jgi:DNA-binding MarR family transcriptional regulator